MLAPDGLRGGELVVGDRRLVVLSFSIEESGTDEDRYRALSPAEREIVALVLAGKTNAAIANARRTSTRTVANQIASILRKLGRSSRRALVADDGGDER